MGSTVEVGDGSIYDTLYVANVSRERISQDQRMASEPIDIYDAAQSRQVDVAATSHTDVTAEAYISAGAEVVDHG